MPADELNIPPVWLHCSECDYCWDDWQPVRAPLSTWVTHVRSFRCPECGAKVGSIYLRAKPLHVP